MAGLKITKEQILAEIPNALATKGKSLNKWRPSFIGHFDMFITDFSFNGQKRRTQLSVAIAAAIKGEKVELILPKKPKEAVASVAEIIEEVVETTEPKEIEEVVETTEPKEIEEPVKEKPLTWKQKQALKQSK